MGEGHVNKFKKSFRDDLAIVLVSSGLLLIALGVVLIEIIPQEKVIIITALVMFCIVINTTIAYVFAKYLTKPTEYLAQAILHISPNEHLVSAPNMDELDLGRELIASLARQVYGFATTSSALVDSIGPTKNNELFDDLPVPVVGVDDKGVITLANAAALKAFGTTQMSGEPLANQLRMDFINESLLDWMSSQREKSVNAQKTWIKVDVRGTGTTRSYHDIVAVFRQHHSSGTETLLVFFEHSDIYAAEDHALSLVALAVHELRTPLTILRGYIEVFEDELKDKLEPDMQNFMNRINTSAEDLTAFVSNIINVAKVDQNQLNMHLEKAVWSEILSTSVDTMRLRAKVRGKEISLQVDDNLPPVAVDKISIAAVLTNLLDNAIKYSPDNAKTIWVSTRLAQDGSVLTTVRDQGVGIPESVMPNLFTKFYRNYRNQGQIAGTGLGLYLSKSIVSAHYGNIWVKSKEDHGSEFSFTLLPYDRMKEEDKKDNDDITRTPHGWIKNHSMQRR